MKVGAHIPRLALGAAREPQEELVEIDLTVAVEVSLGEGPLQLLVSEGRPSTITLQPRQFGRRKARELLLRHLGCMGLQRGCTRWKFSQRAVWSTSEQPECTQGGSSGAQMATRTRGSGKDAQGSSSSSATRPSWLTSTERKSASAARTAGCFASSRPSRIV